MICTNSINNGFFLFFKLTKWQHLKTIRNVIKFSRIETFTDFNFFVEKNKSVHVTIDSVRLYRKFLINKINWRILEIGNWTTNLRHDL